MRRITTLSLRAAAAVAALTAAATVLPAANGAAPAPRTGSESQKAQITAITAYHRDVRGDVVTKVGTYDDIDNSDDGFKPGHGTIVANTKKDRAIDLTKVTYRVYPSAATPYLKVTYRVTGPFHYTPRPSAGPHGYRSLDVLTTVLGDGQYNLEMDSSADRWGTGLIRNSKDGTKAWMVRCKGVHNDMKPGARVATQTIPLSCLAKVGIKTATLYSASVHVRGVPSKGKIIVASDITTPTKELPLTGRGR